MRFRIYLIVFLLTVFVGLQILIGAYQTDLSNLMDSLNNLNNLDANIPEESSQEVHEIYIRIADTMTDRYINTGVNMVFFSLLFVGVAYLVLPLLGLPDIDINPPH